MVSGGMGKRSTSHHTPLHPFFGNRLKLSKLLKRVPRAGSSEKPGPQHMVAYELLKGIETGALNQSGNVSDDLIIDDRFDACGSEFVLFRAPHEQLNA